MRVCGFLNQNPEAFRDPGNVSWIVGGGYPAARRPLSLPTSPGVGAGGCREFVLPTVSSGCSHTHTKNSPGPRRGSSQRLHRPLAISPTNINKTERGERCQSGAEGDLRRRRRLGMKEAAASESSHQPFLPRRQHHLPSRQMPLPPVQGYLFQPRKGRAWRSEKCSNGRVERTFIIG